MTAVTSLRGMRSVALSVVAVSLIAVDIAGQGGVPGGAGLRLLAGVVEQEGTDPMPLRRARVVVSAPGLTADPVFTDERGRFEAYVPASRPFTLSVTKPGYARRDAPFTAAAVGNIRLRLSKGAAINGRVVDQFGDPQAARVLLEGNGMRVAATANDLGEYRFGSLGAGRYTVALLSGGGDGAVQQVQLTAGQEYTVTHPPQPIEEIDVRARALSQFAAAFTPPDAARNAAIRGHVSGSDGRPLGGVAVFAAWLGSAQLPDVPDQSRAAYTDATGRFSFDELLPGTYRVTAAKLGSALLDSSGGRTPIVVSGGEDVTMPPIVLSRLGAISGTVLDEYGEPAEGLTVQLWQRRTGGGRTLLLPVDTVRDARTDDRGRYRLFNAPAGTYYVVVSDEPAAAERTRLDTPIQSAASTAMRVYYPGVSAITDAAPLRVDAGRDAAGIDVVFAPRGSRVQGVAYDAAGRPLRAPVALMDSERSGFSTPARRTAPVAADGTFTFVNVPPGDYVVQGVVPGAAGRPAEFGMQYVTVGDGGDTPVLLRTAPAATLSGQIVLEGDGSDVSPRRFGLSAQPADWDYASTGSEAPRALVREDGSFEMAQLYGPMRITGSAPSGWWLKSVDVNGVDAAAQPFHFAAGGANATAVFADTGASLEGFVLDERQTRSTAYSVLVFSTDRTRWWAPSGHVMLARPDDSGRFWIATLPPGDYLAAAVDTFDIVSEWLDPEVLAALAPLARRLTLPPDGTITTELELIRRPQ